MGLAGLFLKGLCSMSKSAKLALIESRISEETREIALLAQVINKLGLKLAYLKSRGIAGPRKSA